MRGVVRPRSTIGPMERAVGTIVLSGAPRPLLSRTAEARLGPRHRDVLDQLEQLFMANGFASFTIAELAREVGCSRRTLYELAPSKDQLVLIVLDRRLHRMGRHSLNAIDPSAPLQSQLRQYIESGLRYEMIAPLLHDLTDEAPVRRLLDAHYRFVMTVVERLVSLGVEAGEFREVDPTVVATVVTASSLYMNQPEAVEDSGHTVSELLSGMLDLVVGGLIVDREAPT